jgi:flagellar operon protein
MESIKPVDGRHISGPVNDARTDIPGETFRSGFGEELKVQVDESLKLSRHARQRISSREINISDKELESIGKAVQKADSKGIRDSLIMFKDTALIVSVRNKTIVTAMKKDSLKDNVITNVDGVVMM